MKTTLIVIATFFAISIGYSQVDSTNFKAQYSKLLEKLNDENWSESQAICKLLLDYAEPNDSMQIEKKVLRYIYIYSTAGLLNEKKLTKDEALKSTMSLKGKEMITPAHPIKSNCYVNCTHLADEKKNTFFSSTNNAQGTQIFSFEYIEIKDDIKETKEELEGKYIRFKATLDEIAVEGNMLPRFKLKFSNGEYQFLEE